MKRINRRKFIQAGLSSSALMLGGLAIPARSFANAPSCSGGSFRALISIEMIGGLDNFIFSIPTDTNRKNALQARRSPLTTYYSDPDLVQLGYNSNIALHPSLKPLEPYLDTTRLTLGLANTMHVPQTGSHEIAQARMSLGTTQSATSSSGWKGRLYDAGANLIGFSGSKSQNFNCETCKQNPPLVSTNYENYRLSGSSFHFSQGGSNNSNHVASVIEELATMPVSRPMSQLEEEYRISQAAMFSTIANVQEIVSSYQTPLYDAYLVGDDNSSYNNFALRFRNIAQTLLYLQCQNSSERVLFTVPHGSYDVHSAFNSRSSSLMAELGGVLATFIADLKIMGIYEQVVVTTETDFGRQIGSNSGSEDAGTDHGAGFSTLTLGGRINGGRNAVFGDMLSPPQIGSAHSWTPQFDARSLISEIISQHLELDPFTTAFPSAIGQEFTSVNMSLFS